MVPIVNLGNFDANNEAFHSLVKSWSAAMETVGFAIITNHGVDENVLQDMARAVKVFFLEKSVDEKMKFNYGSYGNPKGGYTPMGVEAVARTYEQDSTTKSPPADLVENYVIQGKFFQSASGIAGKGNFKLLHNQDLYKAGLRYYNELVRLMERIHRLSARALGVKEDFFETFYGSDPDTSLRMAHYPPLPGTIEDQQMRYGPHTDYTGFTFLYLPENDPNGLQIFVDGKWTDLGIDDYPPGSFIVNIGDLMSRWTGGKWKSTLHRVLNPPRDSKLAKMHRFSIPFFTGPRSSSLVVPVNYETMDEESRQKFKPILASDHLKFKLGLSNL
uniref:Fe2OG dioxygenase domain-containing protein n=1 Tax=Aplanochytrium stocchinoi TaxID=215587 RepID=A0A6S8CYR9_9STRA|mmetsp:Transcript_1612/g.2142  ORF Transcript_1612/g.2142 Transcript_1612/m.2142 type:complete len:330 (-) Transcript_1612:209-1198(-)|eukprot:CAMPEP_0204878526 /NCGR_PEP_ID=MMETSP1348-20121228/48802_1 /ASSEMBLY_ACC=CAM_ASM_000700 /TAXON_ID=215587 /ORGANISM="Aplanochytrium stocchinoi, Strain GSBS06" /LENGTH=329 /DNA_ID=CAMNT_0052035527 /DNA_START=525 /DNA_END=1514 /DNA_ORIENTATION=-